MYFIFFINTLHKDELKVRLCVLNHESKAVGELKVRLQQGLKFKINKRIKI